MNSPTTIISMKLGTMRTALDFRFVRLVSPGNVELRCSDSSVLLVEMDTGNSVRRWRHGSEVLRLNPSRMDTLRKMAEEGSQACR